MVHDLGHEIHRMIGGKPFPRIRWEQQGLVGYVFTKAFHVLSMFYPFHTSVGFPGKMPLITQAASADCFSGQLSL